MSSRAVGVVSGAGFTCVAALVLFTSSTINPGGGLDVAIIALLMAGLASGLTTAKASKSENFSGSTSRIVAGIILGWAVGCVTLLVIGAIFGAIVMIAFGLSNWTF